MERGAESNENAAGSLKATGHHLRGEQRVTEALAARSGVRAARFPVFTSLFTLCSLLLVRAPYSELRAPSYFPGRPFTLVIWPAITS